MATKPRRAMGERLRILELPWTPLRFLVLVLLIIEGTFAVIAYHSAPDSQLTLFLLDVVAIITIAVMASVLAYLGVFSERNNTYKIFVDPSNKVPIELGRIKWDELNCFVLIGKDEKIQFSPAYPEDAPGGSLELVIPGSNKIDEHTVIRLELKDSFGNSWDVLPFRLWQTRRELRPVSDVRKILQSYPDEDDQ